MNTRNIVFVIPGVNSLEVERDEEDLGSISVSVVSVQCTM